MVCHIENLSRATTNLAAKTTSPTLPSLVDRVEELENQNTKLRDTIRRLRRTAYGGLVPTDTLDLALLISVMTLVVFVGKIAVS